MNDFSKKVFSIFTVAFLAMGLVLPVGVAKAATAEFNNNSLDVKTFQISNSTTNAGTYNWGSSASAAAGNDVAFLIYYHNNSNISANNTKIRVSFSGSSASTQTVSVNVWADNAPFVYDAVTLHISSVQNLTFTSGSVKWYPNQDSNNAQVLPFGQSGDEVTSSSGLNIGNIAGGWSTQGYLTLKAKISSVSAPAITTYDATGIASNSATLNSSVNPNNASTTAWFEYGTSSSSLPYATSTQSLGSGNSSVSMNSSISNLSANTTYYFRAAASNSSGTTYGNVLSFTTASDASAPSVTTDSASNITSSSADLSGSVNPNNASTTAWFEYGTSSSYGSTTSVQSIGSGSSAVSLSDALSNLSANTTYHFRVAASNSVGTIYGSDMSFTTLDSSSNSGSGSNASAPSVTTDSASNITSSSADLSGSVNPNNASTTAWFEYGTSSSSLPYATLTQSIGSGSSSSTATINISSLASNATYYFRVGASNSAGTTYGSVLSFTTASTSSSSSSSSSSSYGGSTNVSYSSPSVTTNSASSIASNSATLNSSVNPNNASTTAWFEYGTSSSSLPYATSTQSLGSGNSALSVTLNLSSLSANITYYFRAAASNSSGTIYGNTLSFTTSSEQTNASAPSITTNAATSVTKNSASLNGTINPNGFSTDVWFEYGTSSASLSYSTAKQNINGSSFVPVIIGVSGLSENKTYYFRPTAQNSSGTTYGAVNSFTTSAVGSSASSSSSVASNTNTVIISSSVAVTRSTAFVEASQVIENMTYPNGDQGSNFSDIGNRLKYTIILKNTGGTSAYNLKVSNQIPNVFKYIESAPVAIYDPVGNMISWNVSRLKSGEVASLYFIVEVQGGLNTTVSSQAKVYLPFASLNIFTNSVSTYISKQKPVALNLLVDKNEVRSGDELDYSLTVKNTNNYSIKNILLSVGLPQNVELIDFDFNLASKNENSLIVDLGSVDAGGQITKSFTVKVGKAVKTNDILTAIAIVNYQDQVGNPQPIVSSSASSTVIGSANLAASIFGGIASFSVVDWLTLIGLLALIFVIISISRGLMDKFKANSNQ